MFRRIVLPPATVESYRSAKHDLELLRAKCADHPADEELIAGMISDCEYVIEWLSTGRRPGSRRGIERRSAYQKEKLMDPVKMQAFVKRSTAGSPANITEDERSRIEEAMCRLTDRERECYVLAHGECFTLREISRMLTLKKSSVQKFVERAHQKISEEVETNLFLRKWDNDGG